jgi:hypothetical protein
MINSSIALSTIPITNQNIGGVNAKPDRLVADASDQIRRECTILLPRFDAIQPCYFLSNQVAI